MLANGIAWIICWMIIPLLLMGLLGLFLGWLFFRGKKTVGDLSVEGEGALRAEADGLRARVQELEGRVSTRDTEVSGLKTKLAAAATAAAAAAVTAKAVSAPEPAAEAASDDESYALEWRNRYLAARVKYLEGRLADKPKVAPKKAPAAKKAPAKKKAVAKKAPKPKVLYTDGPTDGTPDDLKLIKGIGPKFEKDLNGKGIYYFRQIGAWKAADVKMVEGVIDSFPGRIGRDEWVRQAKGLAKSAAKPAAASSGKKKPGPKAGTKRSALTAAGKPRKKPGPKGGSAKAKPTEAEAKLAKYLENVRKYDPKANEDVVKGIVKYCGIA